MHDKRNSYIVNPKETLFRDLESYNLDLNLYFDVPVALTSMALVDDTIQGAMALILIELKRFYVTEFLVPIYDSNSILVKALGPVSDPIKLFDKYWTLTEAIVCDVNIEVIEK